MFLIYTMRVLSDIFYTTGLQMSGLEAADQFVAYVSSKIDRGDFFIWGYV